MAIGCLENLLEYKMLPGRDDTTFWSKTGLIGVTPISNDERFSGDVDCTPYDVKEAFLYRLLEIFNYPISEKNVDIICSGNSGTIAAISHVPSMMVENNLERIMILAVDSYLDPNSLSWLAEQGRLKSAENSSGLTPGEAGACLMLEAANSSLTSRTDALAFVSKPAVEQEIHHYFSNEPNQGVALAVAISRALSYAEISLPFTGDVISDINGECWRAHELGVARVRTAEFLSPMSNFIFPCGSLGETGAASGAVAICFATCALQRGYAHQNTILVVSSSDDGQVGSVCISNN
jgi:3-oxoacyl-[acyl-carrier-protein] synthase-1